MPLGKRTGCQGTKVRKSKAPGKKGQGREARLPEDPDRTAGTDCRDGSR